MKLSIETRKYLSHIRLRNDDTHPIGIIIGGLKFGLRPIVKSIKRRSLAYRSHCVSTGDTIFSIGNKDTQGLTFKALNNLIQESKPYIRLGLEYEINETCFSNSDEYQCRTLTLHLNKSSGTFGFIVRKNCTVASEYPLISNIRLGGPANESGCLKEGDRLIEINGISLSWMSLEDISELLSKNETIDLVIEYNVCAMDSLRKNRSQIDVTVTCYNQDIGLKLASSPESGQIVVGEISKGSAAERCGAFQVGDVILAINSTDAGNLTVSKANHLLQKFKKLPGKLRYIPQKNIIPDTDIQQLEMKKCVDVECNTTSNLQQGETPNLKNNSTMHLSQEYFHMYQAKTLSKFREIVHDVFSIEKSMKFTDNDLNTGRVKSKRTYCSNSDTNKFEKLITLCNETRQSLFSFAEHIATDSNCYQNRDEKISSQCSASNSCNAVQRRLVDEVMENLNELYSKKMIPRLTGLKLRFNIGKMKMSCSKCQNTCSVILALSHKLLLFDLFKDESPKATCTVGKLIQEIEAQKIPCKECETSIQEESNSTVLASTNASESNTHSTLIKPSSETISSTPSHTNEPSYAEIKLDIANENVSCIFYDTRNISSEPQCSSSSKDKDNNMVEEGSRLNLERESCRKFHRSKDLSHSTPKRDWRSAEILSATRDKFNPIAPPNTPRRRQLHASVPIRTFELQDSNPFRAVSSFLSEQSVYGGYRSSSNNYSPQASSESTEREKLPVIKVRQTTFHVKLKNNGKGIGLRLDHCRSHQGQNRISIISAVLPKSAADLSKVIFAGDRILAVDYETTVGLSDAEFSRLQAFLSTSKQVKLKLEIDVAVCEVKFGTFDVCIDGAIKAGLTYKELKGGSPLMVDGVVKGSAAHRSGLVFPGDEILYTNCVRQDFFDSVASRFEKKEMVILTIKRTHNAACTKDLVQPSLPRGPHHIVHRTSLQRVSEDLLLEHEVTLFRDQTMRDFGFLVGQRQRTGEMYVTGIRPGGPADQSKVIKKNDRIVKVNDQCLENQNISVLFLFSQTVGDRLNIITRREHRYHEYQYDRDWKQM